MAWAAGTVPWEEAVTCRSVVLWLDRGGTQGPWACGPCCVCIFPAVCPGPRRAASWRPGALPTQLGLTSGPGTPPPHGPPTGGAGCGAIPCATELPTDTSSNTGEKLAFLPASSPTHQRPPEGLGARCSPEGCEPAFRRSRVSRSPWLTGGRSALECA